MLRYLSFRVLLFLISSSVIVGSTGSSIAYADLPVSEAGLNPDGASYEINADATGKLWVTDNYSGEIWGIDPATGEYDAYVVGGSPVDARHAGDYLWWADSSNPIVRRVKISDGTYTKWVITASSFSSTYVDAQGRFYTIDLTNQSLYQLDPSTSTNNICSFNLQPLLTLSSQYEYMVGSGDDLWIADGWGQLLRLKLSDNSAKVWILSPPQIYRKPIGVALDNRGNVWYADAFQNELGRLNPDTNLVTRFPIPVGSGATMLASKLGSIWYTDSYSGTIGHLDPLVASYATFTPASTTQVVTPTCSTIYASNSDNFTKNHSTLSWVDTSYSTLVNSDGWQIYAMPAGSAPWGIALTSSGFVVDSPRNILSRFPLEYYNISLPFVRK